MFADQLHLADRLVNRMDRGRQFDDGLIFVNEVDYELERDGQIVIRDTVKNLVTNAAKNDLLTTYFNNGTKITSWYIGLVDASSFNGFSAADVISSHSNWLEFTNYTVPSTSDNSRPVWGQGSASNQAVGNATQIAYTFTGAGSLEGIFVVGGAGIKSGNIGLLWSVAPFTSQIGVQVDDILRLGYFVQL